MRFMNIRLDGKAALVTGAGQGIGHGIAVALALAGADVAVNYRTNAAGAAETARQVREAGRQAIVLQADVGDEGQVEAMYRHLDEAFPPLDLLVSNAGHGSEPKPLHEMTWAEWDRVLRSNLGGPFLCGR